jgi:hypothetical protein
MKAAVVIDAWKLPIFTRHLKEAGFSYEERGPLTPEGKELTLTVDTPSREKLEPVIIAAQTECARTKR